MIVYVGDNIDEWNMSPQEKKKKKQSEKDYDNKGINPFIHSLSSFYPSSPTSCDRKSTLHILTIYIE